MEWRNQVAVVTGGARGLGRATARLLAQRGAAVCVNYAVHADAAEALVAEIATAGGRAIAVAADVAESAAVEAMVTRTEAELGPVTILVNNAGVASCSIRHFVFLVRSLVDLLRLDKGNATGPTLGRYCSRGFSHAAPAAKHYKAVGHIFKAAASPVGYREEPHADARLRADARGRDGSLRQVLAAREPPAAS